MTSVLSKLRSSDLKSVITRISFKRQRLCGRVFLKTSFSLAVINEPFLRLIGLRITANPLEAYDDFMRLYEENRFTYRELEHWLPTNSLGFL